MKISKKVVRIGVDLGKLTFHLFGVDESEANGAEEETAPKEAA